jgi:hypothetical protein
VRRRRDAAAGDNRTPAGGRLALKRNVAFPIMCQTREAPNPLNPCENDRIRGLLAEGRGLLEAGRAPEALDVFGRVLLQYPDHADARRGVAEARAAATEARRLLDERLDEAHRIAGAGHRDAARGMLEEVLARGGDRDRAHDLLDRLDPRGGRVQPAGPPMEPEPSPRGARAGPSSATRRAFVVLCAAAMTSFGVGVASSWERLVDRLARTPAPSFSPGPGPSQPSAAPTEGERAISEARRLVERGEDDEALAVLDRVSPHEPAYPFARQLRDQIRARTARRAAP